MSYSNSIRRIRVLATLIIVLYHCFCPFLSHGGWNMYDNTTIESFGHWLCNIVLARQDASYVFYNVRHALLLFP